MVEEMIDIPKSVLKSASTLADVENWLSVNNPRLIDELRRIRREEDLTGQGIRLEELMVRWGIE